MTEMLLIPAIPLVAALLCLAVKNSRVREYVTLVGAAMLLSATLNAAAGALDGMTLTAFGGLLYMDALSAYMLSVIAALTLVTVIYSIEYMRHELDTSVINDGAHRHYYVLFNVFVFTMTIVPLSNNLAMMWISIEATTLVSALLVGFYRKKESIEAAWKYIMLCTVGITFALLGTFIMYYASATLSGEGAGVLEWTSLKAAAHGLNPATVRLSFILIMVGYGTKAGLAPVHNWLPDAHSEAPTPISALLSGILLNCAFYGIMRFAVITDIACGHAFVQDIMTVFGLGSVVIASVFILMQTNSKRLLAYSSIEHMGIISLSFGVGGPFGIYASLLHILNHAMGKPLMFFVTGRIRALHGTVETTEVRGLLKSAPLVGALGFVGLMALTGMPPFGMFISEFLMFRGLADAGRWGVIAVFLAASVLVFYGFIRRFGGMFLGAPPKGSGHGHGTYWPASAVLVALGGGLLLLGLYIPGTLDRLITMSVAVTGGGQ